MTSLQAWYGMGYFNALSPTCGPNLDQVPTPNYQQWDKPPIVPMAAFFPNANSKYGQPPTPAIGLTKKQ